MDSPVYISANPVFTANKMFDSRPDTISGATATLIKIIGDLIR